MEETRLLSFRKTHGSTCWRDPNLEDTLLPMGPFQLDGKQAIVQLGLADFHALGQGELQALRSRC
jgi:hypothetical protein